MLHLTIRRENSEQEIAYLMSSPTMKQRILEARQLSKICLLRWFVKNLIFREQLSVQVQFCYFSCQALNVFV